MSEFAQQIKRAVGDYQIVYADPPWSYRDKGIAGKRGASQHYACMTVPEISAANCLLAMWWVAPMPLEALRVVTAWGFKLTTMKGFTWHKRTKNGLSHFGMGHWTRSNSEDCLFAVKGKPKRVSASVSQLIEAPRGRHSEKPAEVRDRLVRLMGDVRRVELFARNHAQGWDAWGQDLG